MHWEAEKEDALRRVGYSKDRKVDPQIVVGLLVDRTGFPLEIGCFEGNTAETATIVKVRGENRAVDEASLARAQSLVGLKGYVTNVPVAVMPAAEVIAKYHDLWRVEKSFRMSKSDLRGRPMFHHTRTAIEAHLTIVFTALAVAHAIQSRTGCSIAKVIKSLRPLRSATITITGATQTFPPEIPAAEREILDNLGIKPGY